MRPLFLVLALPLAALGDTSSGGRLLPVEPLVTFEGPKSQLTPPFVAPEHWEVRWQGSRRLNIAVFTADGTLVAGAAGNAAALYVSKGGTYRLQIDCIFPAPGSAPSRPSTKKESPFEHAIGGDTKPSSEPAPNDDTYTVRVLPVTPTSYLYPGSDQRTNVDAPSDVPRFKLPAVPAENFAPAPAANPFGTPAPVTAPPSSAPSAPSAPASSNLAVAPEAPPAPAPTVGKLTGDQARAVVLIKGDNAQGTGFLIKTPAGPAIITNIHVIADNPNFKVTTSTGAIVAVLSQKCASDRDLAQLAIRDEGYSYLEMAPDISSVVLAGDEVITPGNSDGGEVMLNTTGKVLGIGPERIEIDNPIYHGNSGGPVYHTKSGKVLGVVTQATKVSFSNELDKTSFASRNSAISGNMRYFALRLDTVTQWIDVDPHSFRAETSFLNSFREQSRRLDAYLNRSDRDNNSNSDESAQIYLNDEKIMRAENNYKARSNGGDAAQRMEALRNLLFDLQSVADQNKTEIQSSNNFYPFDRKRAQEEWGYRKALLDELDSIANNIERLGHLPRSNY